IGLNLVESKRNQGVAAKVVKMLVNKFCEERRVDYFLVRIMSDNSHSKHVFEKMGAVLIGEEDRPDVKLLKELNKLKLEYGEDKISDTVKSQLGDIDEAVFVYKYKLPTEALMD
ncbi:MAG: GNAT family N-acetyltransferase, partial [Ruminiclostridium sp.]